MKRLLQISFGALLFIAIDANAQTNTPTTSCLDSSAGRTSNSVVYVAGSSALRPFLTSLAPLLAGDGYTIVYQSQGSCTGVAAVYGTTALPLIVAKLYPAAVPTAGVPVVKV